jgi:lipase chaperone LimK
MSIARRSTLELELARFKQTEDYGTRKEEPYRQTRRLYFSLPKLANDTVSITDPKASSIQLFKFPESPLNGSKGFRKFNQLDSSVSGESPLQKILKSVKENNTET